MKGVVKPFESNSAQGALNLGHATTHRRPRARSTECELRIDRRASMTYMEQGGAAHWDQAYANGAEARSWFQTEAAHSLHMIDLAGVDRDAAIIDVGGGASTLVDSLLARGYTDLEVLDISSTALALTRRRLGAAASAVTWLCLDLLSWIPQRTYALWHDRAVFHFLTDPAQRARYLRTLTQATAPGSSAVFGCFAPDGPDHCSGLPVARYDARSLAACLGQGWTVISADREEHLTPRGSIQPFTWVVLQRQS
jgi:hypothetical protein